MPQAEDRQSWSHHERKGHPIAFCEKAANVYPRTLKEEMAVSAIDPEGNGGQPRGGKRRGEKRRGSSHFNDFVRKPRTHAACEQIPDRTADRESERTTQRTNSRTKVAASAVPIEQSIRDCEVRAH